MSAELCDTWTDEVDAVDAFLSVLPSTRRPSAVLVSFGVASPREDNSDILTSRAIQQKVLDLLDEPLPR